jgi:tetratricopeptide (TPR) repeat protein
VLAALTKTLTEDHPETIGAANHLANLLNATGPLDEAAALNARVLASCRRVLGDDHPFTIMSMNNTGMTLMKQRRFRDAEPLFAEAYRRAPASELDAQKAAYCMARWGPCLVLLERYREAEAPLKEAHQRLTAAGITDGEVVRNVLVGLMCVAEKLNRPEEAARWRAKLEAM